MSRSIRSTENEQEESNGVSEAATRTAATADNVVEVQPKPRRQRKDKGLTSEPQPVESHDAKPLSISKIVLSGLKPDVYMEFYECCERLRDLVTISGVPRDEILKCVDALINEKQKLSKKR